MPELPEVETVRRILKPAIINKEISDIVIEYSKIIKDISCDQFKKELIGQKIINVNRTGKYLLVEFNKLNLAIHLRMEGKLFYYKQDKLMEKHDHIKFYFTDGTILIYNDTRKFGTMHLVDKKIMDNFTPITKLGIEPHSPELSCQYLQEKFAKISKSIKQTLLDQTIISGLGNIYVDEVLFASKIHPLRATKSLTVQEIAAIVKNCKIVIEQAIVAGGTTIKSFEITEGESGRFQQELQMYGRTNENCYFCQTRIEKIKVGGRGTHFCPNCQENK